MARTQKKVRGELIDLFPLQFPDNSEAIFDLRRETLRLEIDELLEPDSIYLDRQRDRLQHEFLQLSQPIKVSGPGSQLTTMRKTYIDNRIAMELEGLNVDDSTPSVQFWRYIEAMERKFKAKNARNKPPTLEGM